MGNHAKDVIFPLLEGVDEKNLQQREVQVEQHAQNAASHEHLDHIGMDVGWGDLGEVEKFFEKRWEREPEPSIELLLGKADSVLLSFLSRHGLSVHKFNGHAIWDAETFAKLPHIQLIHGFLSMSISGRAG